MTTRTAEEQVEGANAVRAMFERIAGRYDVTNDAMTMGQHRLWRKVLLRAVDTRPGDQCLDLATGTGDLARRLAAAAGPGGSVVGLDFTPGMLDQARVIGGDRITYVEGDMLALPFEANRFDVATCGFGLRNVMDLRKALEEAYRVLAPGGRFASLDLAKPRQAWIQAAVDAYSFGIVPLIGRVVGRDADAYQYLPASNKGFVTQEELGQMMREIGFTDVRVRDLALGTTAVVSGRKP